MTKQEFPDLTYPVTKIYEGIKRQDYAELSAGYVDRIRDELQAFKPEISDSGESARYESNLDSVMQALSVLQDYYKKFHSGHPRMKQSMAIKIHEILLKEIKLLESLSKG